MNRKPLVLLALVDPIVYPPVMPYGLGILKSALSKKGINSKIIWPHLEGTASNVLNEALKTEQPALVGFSFRNLDTAGFHYSDTGEENFLYELKTLVSVAKDLGFLSVIGGSGFSIAPKEILEYIGGDIGFVGPSETHFAEFCRRIITEDMSSKEAILGLSTGLLSGGPKPSLHNLPLLAPSDTDCRVTEFAKLVGGMVPLRTKSGCSCNCSYCVVPIIEPLMLRPWQDIRNELKNYVDSGLGSRIFIADGEFNLPSAERAFELSNYLSNEFPGLIKWRCYLNPYLITPKLAEAMVAANCVGVSLSVDSFADGPRKGLGKDGTYLDAINAVNHCLNAGFKNVLINLIFGGPNETIDTAKRTAEIAKDFHLKGAGINVTIGLRVYPRTPLAKISNLAKFTKHYYSCNKVGWLGKFCSPIAAEQLAPYVEGILRPRKDAIYNHSQSEKDTSFYHDIAHGSGLLFRKDFDAALKHFEDLIRKHSLRPELELGLLKAKTHFSENSK